MAGRSAGPLNESPAMILAALAAAALAAAPAAPDEFLKFELRDRDQAMLDADASGDRRAWESALAPGALLVDENGVIMSREAAIAQVAPLPTGASGHIEMTGYRLSRSGDVASVIHTDAEIEVFHGQTLHATYLTTEAWRRGPDGWKIVLIHIFAVPTDPPAIAPPAADLAAYAGRYQAGPDLFFTIKIEDGKLVGGRDGRPAAPLLAELRDVFFVAGQPRVRKNFQRDGAGRITGFVDRREGEDLVWTRVGPG